MSQAARYLHRSLKLGILLAAALLVWSNVPASRSAPDPAAPALTGELHIAGASTMVPLLQSIAARYRAHHPGVRVHVTDVGSAGGIEALRRGGAELALVPRTLEATEQDLVAFPIARDGIAAVVHRDNAVTDLRLRDMIAIHAGQIDDWHGVGGSAAPIHLLVAGADSASERVLHRYLGSAAPRLPADAGNDEARMAAVASDPAALAFVSLGRAERAVLDGLPIRLVRLDFVDATSRTLRLGQYPLVRPLSLVSRGLPTGLARDFVQYALSTQVTDLVQAEHFVAYLD